MTRNSTNRPSAREAILDTAERLFAERGMEAVSLRTINTEAGYSVAALHYHFGTREGLVDALLERRRGPILARRQELLAQLETDAKPDIHRIAEALLLPLAELVYADPEDGIRTIRFLFRAYMERSDHAQTRAITEQSYRIFDELLSRALPGIDRKLLQQRWQMATELAFQGLANIENIVSLSGSRTPEADYRSYTGNLVDFIAGGLSAPAGNNSRPGS